MKKGVEIVADPKKARVLIDPMRREIVRLLAERSMTENELSEVLGLSNPSVGHHLRILRESGFIRIVKKEAERHGILQKYYQSNALAYFVDVNRVPLEIGRYFMPASLERVRGAIAALNAVTEEFTPVDTKELEELAKLFTSAILQIAPKYQDSGSGDRETTINKIYQDALTSLLRRPNVLPEKVRRMLLRVYKT